MIKKLTGIAMLLIAVFCANAQMPQPTPLPLNPKVKTGKLSNGLTYYIMHNEEPKNRANFYIAQKVGSTLETQDQLGLAHFLEHMAFNGTTNYPGKNMLNYLQSKGIRFGADINAYTSFDETVYNINNVPTSDQALMDSVLLVLHDWSGGILLEESEIDAERGVIQEEWRQRNDAQNRMYTAILPQIYQEYQYQQMPIGKMEVVMNFKPETIRAYYKKWYRPDQQGIVIVGDFDVNDMEKKVKELFSTIEMPKNAAKREYQAVSDNKKPIYASFTDPELKFSLTTISFKSDKMPIEFRNTVEGYLQTSVLETILDNLISNRLTDFALDPQCNYAQAGVYFGNFYVSKVKDSFNIQIVPKTNTEAAVADAMAVVARACNTGFTFSEYDRVREEILANMEKLYNEREKTENDSYGKEIIRFFIDNEPAPGIEVEYELWKQAFQMIPLEAINEIVKTILTEENMVIVTSEPQKDGVKVVAEDAMVKIITDAMKAKYEPMVEEVITDPMISQLPKPGKITNMVNDPVLGTTTYTLSNGIKVVMKTTDFAADEVNMVAFREGGKQIYDASQADNVKLVEDVFSTAKMGPFDTKTLRKYLAGKKAALGFSMNAYTDMLRGASTVKDLPTLMELIYTAFTNLNPDQTTFQVAIDGAKSQIESQMKDPRWIFFDQMNKTRYGNNPLLNDVTLSTLENANYDEMMNMLHAALKNAAEYTFIFSGNVDNATIRPLLEQYIATLPVALRKKTKVVTPITIVEGDVVNEFKQPMQAPGTSVFDIYNGTNLAMNIDNDVKMSMVGDILDMIYVETLREEEGGTYGASVGAQLNPNDGKWMILYYFQTNADQQAALIKRADDELRNLLANGAKEEHFNKVKEAMLKQLDINERTNGYWTNGILSALRGFDTVTGHREAIEKVTLSDLNEFMKNLYDGKNRIQVIMEGVQAE